MMKISLLKKKLASTYSKIMKFSKNLIKNNFNTKIILIKELSREYKNKNRKLAIIMKNLLISTKGPIEILFKLWIRIH